MHSTLTRMRLIYRQNRFEVFAIVGFGLLFAVAAFVEAWRLNAVVFPRACDATPYFGGYGGVGGPDAPSAACLKAQAAYSKLWQSPDVGIVRMAQYLLPFVAGIILGAPLVSREVEQRTAPLSWVLAGSRRRWLLARVFAMLALIVPLLLLAGVASNVLYAASNRGMDPLASLEEYGFRGASMVFWSVAAFTGAVGLSVLLRRTLPSVIVALVVCFFVMGFSSTGMRKFVLPPIAVEQAQPAADTTNVDYRSMQADLLVYQRFKLDGAWWDGDIGQWYMDHQPPMTEIRDANGTVTGIATETPANWNPPQPVNFVVPGSQYWLVVGIESGLLLAGSLVLTLFGLLVIERRRPY